MESDLNLNRGVLDPQKIIDTIEMLNQRISERFPNSGLSRVCKQLDHVAENMKTRAEWIGRPVKWLRILIWVVCLSILAFAIIPVGMYFLSADSVPLNRILADPAQVITLSESVLNDVVLIGAAIFFFLTLETRYKRQRALKAIHELRTIAHVIDMHQLTKDPHRIAHRGTFDATTQSPKFEMTKFQLRRYLDYCSEMLSLTGKVAAVYVQQFDDGVALASVSELETLTTGLSSKIWQKIAILHTVGEDEPPKLIH